MWSIEYDPGTRVLTLRLVLQVTAVQMRSFARAHTQALAATGGEPFKVLADLRGLTPLDVDAAQVLGDVRRAAAALATFRGRATLTDSPTVAMQQRRSLIEEGTPLKLEVITMDERDAKAFVARGA